MACLVANFVTQLEVFTSIKNWTKPKSSSCLAIPCFENLKCFRPLETTIGFESTLCIITSLANGLGNKTSLSEIVCSMQCVALLMVIFHKVCKDFIEFCVSLDYSSNVFCGALWHCSCERCYHSWSNWILSTTLSLKVIALLRGPSLDCPNCISLSLVLPMKTGSIRHWSMKNGL